MANTIQSTMEPAPAAGKTEEPRGRYTTVNDLKFYYEIHGEVKGGNPPVVLLHGGVVGLEAFGPNLPALAERGQVIAVDMQGHGRTGDIDRPLRFEWMADDIAALVKQIGFERADFMGYSLGGGVALQTAIRHPNLVRKLVLISTPFKRSGWYPEVLAGMAQMTPAAAEGMKQSPLYTLYPDVYWSTLFTKLNDLLGRDYDWSQDVAAIKAPVMLVYADADGIRLSHIVEFYRLFGGGQHDAGLDGSGRPADWLAIVPGLTHYNILSSATVAELVKPFLELQASNR